MCQAMMRWSIVLGSLFGALACRTGGSAALPTAQPPLPAPEMSSPPPFEREVEEGVPPGSTPEARTIRAAAREQSASAELRSGKCEIARLSWLERLQSYLPRAAEVESNRGWGATYVSRLRITDSRILVATPEGIQESMTPQRRHLLNILVFSFEPVRVTVLGAMLLRDMRKVASGMWMDVNAGARRFVGYEDASVHTEGSEFLAQPEQAITITVQGRGCTLLAFVAEDDHAQ